MTKSARLSVQRSWADPEIRKRRSEGIKRAFADPELRKRSSEASRRSWADPNVRKSRSEGIRRALADPKVRRRKSEAAKRAFADPKLRKRRSEATRRSWADPHVRTKRREGIRRAFANPDARKRLREGIRRSLRRPDVRERRSEALRRSWAIPDVRSRRIRGINRALADPEVRKRRAEAVRRAWADPAARKRQSKSLKRALADPDVRKRVTYLWPDLKSQGKSPKNVLSSAGDLHDGTMVVFYDDNVGSAGQSITVLQQWCGIKPDSWLVNEKHVDPLSVKKLKMLRKARIMFLFATGRRKGLQNLINKAKELFANDKIEGQIIFPDDISCFRSAAGVFPDKLAALEAEEAFRKAGRKALGDKSGTWKDSKVDDRLLGYGNCGGLNVFYYNVPTATLTALWKSSEVPGAQWLGLFPRRPRE